MTFFYIEVKAQFGLLLLNTHTFSFAGVPGRVQFAPSAHTRRDFFLQLISGKRESVS